MQIDIWSSLSYTLMFLGLVGAIIPVLPGPILIWIGALVFATSSGFEKVGIPTLVVLAFIMILAWGSELTLTTLFTKRVGATWKTVVGAVVGGIVGASLLSAPLPVVGTIFGAALGAAAGVVFVESQIQKRKWNDALRVSRNYLAGCLIGRVVEVLLCLLMIGIFVLQISR
jgi:hypothetical protein